ncbi:Fis family transcriptional regulator [Anaeromyxobacter paludicola]|uniref:Uncharacterized protein n=1 Tax=Anaeromyxobacter paludicola TaxID=2918171 RepID=A0ABN6N6M4_9BACT|nr:Fis family transcriptional regulator [Anaeromyxobacter paludicola]BDG07788.1 hypothetical protein AMPC_09010 [Anaeromyxobacter paludicola]
MAELDDELIARVMDWCAEAGRPTTAAEVRAALSPLGWDDLLAARALLADPPPARPLGPRALADLARGASPAAAVERELAGGPVASEAASVAEAGADAAAGEKPARRPRKRRGQPAGPVVRRARDRQSTPASPAPGLPLLDELLLPEGRAVLERLQRRLGARRKAITAALAAGWRHPDDAPPAEADLEKLLAAHGLSRGFARRERELLLHAVRAAGGVLSRAARSVELSAEELGAALARAGALPEAERIRAERGRQVLRQAATLSERVHLLLADEERLAELGVLPAVLSDLRARLPEHLRALRASTPARFLLPALARSLSVPRVAAESLARRFQLSVGEARPAGPRTRTGEGHEVDPAPAPRPRSPRPGGAGPSSSRPAGRAAPSSPRSGPRPSSPRAGGPRPSSPRAGGAARPPATRSDAAAPRRGPPRPSGPSARPGAPGTRSGPPRPGGARPGRPAGPRRPR